MRQISSAEMDVMILVDALTGVADSRLLPITSKMGKETARNFRHAVTLLKKALVLYGEEMSEDDLNKLQHRSLNSEVVIRPKLVRKI